MCFWGPLGCLTWFVIVPGSATDPPSLTGQCCCTQGACPMGLLGTRGSSRLCGFAINFWLPPGLLPLPLLSWPRAVYFYCDMLCGWGWRRPPNCCMALSWRVLPKVWLMLQSHSRILWKKLIGALLRTSLFSEGLDVSLKGSTERGSM